VNAENASEPFEFVGTRIETTAFDVEESPAPETSTSSELGLREPFVLTEINEQSHSEITPCSGTRSG
jgi:hypothetical protein